MLLALLIVPAFIPATLRPVLAPLLRCRELNTPVSAALAIATLEHPIVKTQPVAKSLLHTIQNVSGRLFLPLTRRQIVYNIFPVLKRPTIAQLPEFML